jgi:uncharacterized integral membrane protein
MSEQDRPGDDAVEQPRESRTPVTQILGRVFIGVLVLVFLVFAAANAQYVSFSWVVGETRARFDETGGHVGGGVRLIVLLVGTFFLGILIGALLSWQEYRRKRREARKAL